MLLLNAVFYYLLIIPFSLLPFRVLYFFSDLLYLILFRLLGYRKKIVTLNLRNSFPAMSNEEIEKTASLFYHHFCDVIVESLKSFTISKEQILKRMVLKNPELLNSYYDKGKSLILAGGHYNNWEWIATSIDQQIKHKSIAIYKTLNNRFFDEKMRSTRSRFGLQMISTKKVKEIFEQNRKELTATIFANDQSPGKVSTAHWMKFLNQDTAVLFGTEKYAREYNYPVLFGTIHKVKRGYYIFFFQTVEDNPATSPHGEITEKTTRLLEQEIIKAPQYWLWTHRRWKHKKLDGVIEKVNL
jgi:Kdo2-lipid IVA lauroyltransferase/acyltransferase